MMKITKSKLNKIANQILASSIPILIAFAISAIAIILAKENPLSTYYVLISKSLFNIKGLLKTLHYAAPLILSGLAIAVSFKAGLFNMGIEGQIISAGFVVAILGYSLQSLPSIILIPLLLIIGILVGVLVALIPAIIKARWNVNEMVVTLLLNYAILQKHIDKIVIGVTNIEELKQNIDAHNYIKKCNELNKKLDSFAISDEQIILPFNWR